MKIDDNLLPVGSIVTLKNQSTFQEYMIIQVGVLLPGKGRRKFFEYGATKYPDGLVGDELTYFRPYTIDKIIFTGYKNDACKKMNKKIGQEALSFEKKKIAVNHQRPGGILGILDYLFTEDL